ncbi:enoyl-CoA hydratase/isomerase family protein [Litoribacter ruber]|uniref:Enoyl-CoA hydratase/isomerase family protein n=1 Tax=Litoribacter ruber TaxID=702568 RepID=A0AAP2G1G3_9BACT|nr:MULTISPECIES: enoyl-CoA hydratase-related protein [Litoribacter]MBS9524122.1 enoyl-CoA hydratase/isomerase family protein [Litoribacter alkaliphilus]MBT0811294.1 enoyl-CoA hydratase/isomerase family protein [Litoribacter ruber]
MNYNTIVFSEFEQYVELKLNRPTVYNALNQEMLSELLEAFKAIESDDRIRCVVLTGTDKAFSSGQDLKSVGGDLSNVPFESIIKDFYNPLILKMRSLNKPIICKLNGVAAGAGCSLALACDMIISSDDAYLAEIFVNIGLIMDAGSTFFLPRALGSFKAFEIATTGAKVYGKEAESLGLVNKSVPALELDDEVQKMVNYYTTAPTYAIGLIKEMLNESNGMKLEEVLEMESVYQQKAGNSHDFREGVMAFLEKRRPNFQGK